MVNSISYVVTLAAVASAHVAVYQQCGGSGWTGETACAPSASCTVLTDRYHQCVPTASLKGLKARATARSNETKYFISFGDSYSQTGFNIDGEKPSAANPIGNPPLPGWTASGGLDWPGFMVTEFNQSLTLSYNFAYGGATTDAEIVPPYSPEVLSFIDQVEQFSGSIASKPSYAPWTATNSLVGVWMGVNDVGNTFWLEDQPSRLAVILDRYFEQLQILYDAGLRNFVLLSVPPTDKTPLMLANPEESLAQLRASIDTYNELVKSNLDLFTSANKGVTAKIVDTSVAFNTAIEDPERFGAPDATCESSDGVSCLWFNNYHPGVQIQKLVAAEVAKAWPTFFRQ